MDYQKLYNALISFRKSNPLKKSKKLYTELHHIVPRCLGGTNVNDNLVRLTAREHFIAHRLLAKIHPDIKELTLALVLMIRGRGRDNKIASSREFYRLKEISSNTLSSYMTSSLLHLWKTESYRSRMQGVLSKSNSERWKDESFKLKMSEKLSRAAIKRCEGSQNKKRMSDAMNGFYERNPHALDETPSSSKQTYVDPCRYILGIKQIQHQQRTSAIRLLRILFLLSERRTQRVIREYGKTFQNRLVSG